MLELGPTHRTSFYLESESLSRVQLYAIPWTIVCQAPLSMEFSRQEYWGGFPFPSPGDVPNTRLNPYLLHWQLGSVLLSHKGSPPQTYYLLNLSSASNFTKVKGSSLFFFFSNLGFKIKV